MAAGYRDESDVTAPSDDFVGRENELDTIITLLLRQTRLLTLIGPGGIGKTRLAAQASRLLEKARHTPVHWVRLARLAADSSAAAVEEEITRSVVTTDYSDRSMWEALVTALAKTDARGRAVQTVLVVDNCEHVLPSIGRVIARMLDAIPELCIVATSREAIGWVDERLFAVPALSPHQALSLFRYRAELTGHPITGPEQAALAARICQRMDHHPLFIRLAAGHLVRQPLAMILGQLGGTLPSDRRLDWASGPTLGGEERHRSINDVLSWSYDLCQEKEKLLFDRMSVFAGGYDTGADVASATAPAVGADLDAIRVICAGPSRDGGPGAADDGIGLVPDEIEDLLGRLADQSLVSRHLTTTTVRYSLSENLRVYAQQKLSARSADGIAEAAWLAERHSVYYRDKILHAAASYFGPAEGDLIDWASAAWNNIITAIERSLTPGGSAHRGLEICVGLLVLRLPFVTGSFREIRLWTERALVATRARSSQPGDLQVTAMALLVWIMLCVGQIEDAEQLLEECVQGCLSDPGHAWREAPERDLGLPAVVDFALGVELMVVRKDPVAVTVLERAREKFDHAGSMSGAVPSEQFAALAASLLGPPAQAHDLAWRYLERTTAAGSTWTRFWAQLTWSIALTRLGKPTEALAIQRSVLANLVPTREQWGALWAVEFRAWSLARIISEPASGPADRRAATATATEIAVLAGGTRTLRTGLGVDIDQLGPFADLAAEAVRTAEKVLGPQAYAGAEARGSALRPELNEVQHLAMGTLAIGTRPTPVGGMGAEHAQWLALTVAEQEVAALAAEGWTNSAIAARRGTSRRTIDAQVATVLQKLQITSRADIVRFVPKRQGRRADAKNKAESR
ncbi:AAA family ATPase [Nocardia sp. NPDC049190]|uniref:ATP-binding protein n=1 Tax=Nocardia sp. NPDC049190 TaxID=3155650 RepID=UPI0033CD6C20